VTLDTASQEVQLYIKTRNSSVISKAFKKSISDCVSADARCRYEPATASLRLPSDR
jgi:hypothetical protein